MDIKRIMFATDFSETSQKALGMALTLRDSLDAHLDLVHVFDREAYDMPLPYGMMPGAAQWIDDHRITLEENVQNALRDMGCKLGECKTHFIEGRPGPAIVEFADEHHIDLIVMGTHGYKGFQRIMMGSVAEYVLRHSSPGVLTVKSEEIN